MSLQISKENHTKILQEFRTLVNPDLCRLTESDWQKEDWYLLKFLHARNFNPVEASQMLINCLKWRKEYHPGSLKSDDFPNLFFETCPEAYLGLDKDGYPTFFSIPGKGDVTKCVEQFGEKLMIQYLVFQVERALSKIREDCTNSRKMAVYIADMDECVYVIQGCQ